MAKTHAGAFAFGIGAAFPFPGIRNFDSRVEGSGFFRNHLDIPSSPLRREHDDQGIRCETAPCQGQNTGKTTTWFSDSLIAFSTISFPLVTDAERLISFVMIRFENSTASEK